MQDAHNLAWKLAAVLRGVAGPDLLATYNDERQPYGVIAMQQAFARFGDRMANGAEVELLDYAAVTTGYQYRSSAVIGAAADSAPLAPTSLAGQPGTRAPHVARADGTSTLDRYGSDFVLLTGADGGAWKSALAGASKHFGATVRSAELDAHEVSAHGIGTDGAVLVRPDGFVAWRREHLADEPSATLANVLRAVLSVSGRQ